MINVAFKVIHNSIIVQVSTDATHDKSILLEVSAKLVYNYQND